jgi:hypothetical protein
MLLASLARVAWAARSRAMLLPLSIPVSLPACLPACLSVSCLSLTSFARFGCMLRRDMGIVELKLLLQGQGSILLEAHSPAPCILRLRASRSAPRVCAPASRASGAHLSISTAYSTCDIFAVSVGGARRRQILHTRVARRGVSACVVPHVLPALVHHCDARLARYVAGACSPRHRHTSSRAAHSPTATITPWQIA